MNEELTIREQSEELERMIISPNGVLSANSKGRLHPEEKCPVRTDFQRDRDRIVHCKAFRRLKHKTQVFIDPEEDHFRTRLTHTLEVSQIARTIARALRLNEDLTEAISLGHDLGHTPFGHIGERVLNQMMAESVPGGRFKHSEQSLRVVDFLERDGRGLNLTAEVRDGILHHSKGDADLSLDTRGPSTLEGRVVKISDRVAYINHDIDDAIRAGMIVQEDIPRAASKLLGDTHSDRISTMVGDIVRTSIEKNTIGMGEEVRKATNMLKDFLYATVYGNASGKQSELKHVEEIMRMLFQHYMSNPVDMFEGRPEHETSIPENVTERARMVCDFISCMTDRYAQRTYAKTFLPWL